MGSMSLPSAAATKTRGPSCIVVPPIGIAGSRTEPAGFCGGTRAAYPCGAGAGGWAPRVRPHLLPSCTGPRGPGHGQPKRGPDRCAAARPGIAGALMLAGCRPPAALPEQIPDVPNLTSAIGLSAPPPPSGPRESDGKRAAAVPAIGRTPWCEIYRQSIRRPVLCYAAFHARWPIPHTLTDVYGLIGTNPCSSAN